MSPFTCDSPGCGEEAKVGGKCLKCYKKGYDVRQKTEAEEEGQKDDADDEGPLSTRLVDERCADCGKARRRKMFFKGRCGACHTKGIRGSGRRPGRKKKADEVGVQAPAGFTPGKDPIKMILDGLHASIETARRHRQALIDIKELTGAKIDIPDISF